MAESYGIEALRRKQDFLMEARMGFAIAGPRSHADIIGVTDDSVGPRPDNRIYGLAVFPYWWRCAKLWVMGKLGG